MRIYILDYLRLHHRAARYLHLMLLVLILLKNKLSDQMRSCPTNIVLLRKLVREHRNCNERIMDIFLDIYILDEYSSRCRLMQKSDELNDCGVFSLHESSVLNKCMRKCLLQKYCNETWSYFGNLQIPYLPLS